MRLGDRINGFVAEETLQSVSDIVPWLQEAIAHFYPQSEYAVSLDAEVRTRAARRIFSQPRTGARAFCPHCGAPHASPGLDELIAFTSAMREFREGRTTDVPRSLHRCLATSNIVDNPHSGVRSRTRRVCRWRPGMPARWSAAAFLEAEKSFRKIMGFRNLWALKAILDGSQPATRQVVA